MLGSDAVLTGQLIQAGEVVIALVVLFAMVWFIMRPLITIITTSAKDAEAKREELIALRQETNEHLRLNRLQLETAMRQIDLNTSAMQASRSANEATQIKLIEVKSELERALDRLREHVSDVSQSAAKDIIEAFPTALTPILEKLAVLDRIEHKADELASDTAMVRETVIDMKQTLISALVTAVVKGIDETQKETNDASRFSGQKSA